MTAVSTTTKIFPPTLKNGFNAPLGLIRDFRAKSIRCQPFPVAPDTLAMETRPFLNGSTTNRRRSCPGLFQGAGGADTC